MRVAVELVEAATQQTRWSDQYERELADVLAVQSQVALQLAGRLAAKLSPAERERIEPAGHAQSRGVCRSIFARRQWEE